MTGFLFSPRVPKGAENANCVSVIDLGPAHLHVNCDSQEFERLAADPSLILSSNRTWQTRPLYPLLGKLLSEPIHLALVNSVSDQAVSTERQASTVRGRNQAAFLPEYFGFVTLNFLLLLFSVLLFRRISGATWVFDPLILFPLAMIVVNQVTKAFFWTPHLQIFNVFIPIVSFALFQRLLDRGHPLSWWRTGLVGLGVGISFLAYGAFAVTAAGAAVCIMAARPRSASAKELSTRAARAGLLLLTFLAPTAAWTSFVVYRTGSFYSHEIEHYRQFVWITDSLRTGGFLALLGDLATKSGQFVDTLRVVLPLSLLMATVLAGFLYVRGGLREAVRGNQALLVAIAVYVLIDVLFFWLMGYYASRLTWTVVPAIALLLALELQALDRTASDNGRRVLRGASVAATVLYVAYWYVRPGPWS